MSKDRPVIPGLLVIPDNIQWDTEEWAKHDNRPLILPAGMEMILTFHDTDPEVVAALTGKGLPLMYHPIPARGEN